MKALDDNDFRRVIIKAGAISFAVLIIFLFLGELIFTSVLNIRYESFRIFGGIVLFSFAYMYIVKGQKALLTLKENLDDLASEIALPFMVGAGTISLTLVVSQKYDEFMGTVIVVLSVLICVLTILFLKQLRHGLKKERLRVAFDKNMEILIRLNGFFVGAIGIDMIRSGIFSLLE